MFSNAGNRTQWKVMSMEGQTPSGQSRVLTYFDREIVETVENFRDPSQEWRRLFSELLGTFFLVLVAAGAGMMGQAFPNTISRTAAVVAPGMMVLAIILFMGKVSGAHLNPGVSIAFSLRGDFPWRRLKLRASARQTPGVSSSRRFSIRARRSSSAAKR
jgi:Major intrinsic protein